MVEIVFKTQIPALPLLITIDFIKAESDFEG